ncbi:MAG: nucleotide exchange factor GrpE [Candidatus Krumholzibacteria bacterium]|nr:nucleotide exchange factor GrpE [Candidatus Krumholzibacteria bacterium]
MSKKRHQNAAENDEAAREETTAPRLDEVVDDAVDEVGVAGAATGQPNAAVGLEPPTDLASLHAQVAELQAQVADLQTQVAEHTDRRLRTAAELDNLRKRSRRDVEDARRFAQADLLRSLLGVLDDFDRALQCTPVDGSADGDPGAENAIAAYRQGLELIAQNFRQVLLDAGVRRIETAGRAFDPAVHEAIGQGPATDSAPSGTILAETQSGYTFDDLVLRASRVIVAQ